MFLKNTIYRLECFRGVSVVDELRRVLSHNAQLFLQTSTKPVTDGTVAIEDFQEALNEANSHDPAVALENQQQILEPYYLMLVISPTNREVGSVRVQCRNTDHVNDLVAVVTK